MSPQVLISILGLNKSEATKACLEAVLKNSGDQTRYFLFLTNNGSQDDTPQIFEDVKGKHPQTFVINNTKNEGFIGPNNEAFEFARLRGIPFFICLNNDAEVPPFWLDYMLAPLLLDANGALSGPGHYRLNENMHGTDGGPGEYLEGSCLCAKVELVAKYGHLFSDYLTFIYGDDSDLSLRMREKGHAIYQVPFTLKHSRCTTVKQSPEVQTVCAAAQEHNHAVLHKRWDFYLKNGRRFNYPIILRRSIACGDTLLLTPVIRALKKSNPLSPLYVETKSPDVLQGNPYLTGCMLSDRYPPRGALSIDLEMAYENRQKVHIIDAYIDAVRWQVPALGPVDHRIEMFQSLQDVFWAINLKVKHQFGLKVCVMHLDHGSWPGKNWPKERFAAVAKHLVDSGWHVVLVGSQRAPERFDGLDMTGKTTALQLYALLKCAQLFIGGDSFPLHAAVAAGCPVIGIFGVTSSHYIVAEASAPLVCLNGDPAVPGTGQRHLEMGSRCVVTTDDCIRSVSVERVIEAMERMA